MRNLTITILLTLALFAGCSVSASLHGQELSSKLPSNLFELTDPPARAVSAFAKFQNLKRSLLAIVRIRHRDSKGQVNWFGSGIVIKKQNGYLYLLSNQHVCVGPNDSGSIEIEFMDASGHKSLGFFQADVLAAIQKNNIDAAVVRIKHGKTLSHIPTLPLGSDVVESNTLLVQTGADGGHPVNQSLGYALKRQSGLIYYLPSSYGGDSGSAIISEDGLRTVGLVAWSTYLPPITGPVGLAQTVPAVVAAFKTGKTSPLPNNTFSVSDQRFGRRPQQPSQPPIDQEELDDLFGIEEAPETPSEPPVELEDEAATIGPLRNLLDRLIKGQQDLKDGQGRDSGAISGLSRQIGTLKYTLLWMWRICLIVLVIGVAGVLFGNAWLSRFALTFFRVILRGTSAAYHVIVDAVSTTPKSGQSVEDQLAEIRSTIQKDFQDEGETS